MRRKQLFEVGRKEDQKTAWISLKLLSKADRECYFQYLHLNLTCLTLFVPTVL